MAVTEKIDEICQIFAHTLLKKLSYLGIHFLGRVE